MILYCLLQPRGLRTNLRRVWCDDTDPVTEGSLGHRGVDGLDKSGDEGSLGPVWRSGLSVTNTTCQHHLRIDVREAATDLSTHRKIIEKEGSTVQVSNTKTRIGTVVYRLPSQQSAPLLNDRRTVLIRTT